MTARCINAEMLLRTDAGEQRQTRERQQEK